MDHPASFRKRPVRVAVDLTRSFGFCYGGLMRREMPRRQSLLDPETRAKLPPLYSGEALGLEALALVKFFTPDSNWTWYASEFDQEDTLFGLVSGFEVELGYFALSELEEGRGPRGLPIERDLYYQPKTLGQLMEEHGQRRWDR